jgi:hypothetical protein
LVSIYYVISPLYACIKLHAQKELLLIIEI